MSRGGRWPRSRRAAGLAAAVMFALPLAAAGTAGADPTPTPSSSNPALPVSVTLVSLQPYAPQPGGTVTVVVRLDNVGSDPIGGVGAALEVSRTKVGTRNEFDFYAASPDGLPPADAVAVSGATVTVPRAALPVGAHENVTITTSMDSLALPQVWQVYELAIVVQGDTPVGRLPVGRLRTFLPYAPVDAPGSGQPIRLAWVWPLADRPHRVTDTTWTDDGLAAELAPGGRLQTLVHAGVAAENQHRPPPPPPRHKHKKKGAVKRAAGKAAGPPQPPLSPVAITWAVDPMVVDDATAMAAGYSVGTGDHPSRGRGQAAARAWLSTLKSAAGVRTGGGALRTQVLALPYADPDVTALVRSGLTTELGTAITKGQELLGRELGVTPIGYAWPPDGFADERTLEALFAAGVTTVVLDSTALPPLTEPNATPTARTPVQTRVRLTGLLSDHLLDQVTLDGAVNPANGPLDTQRLLSELLMVQAEAPFTPRTVVVAPPRRWAPSPAYADALLAGTGQVPWVRSVRLSQAAASRPSDLVRPRLVYPVDERLLRLGRDYLNGVNGIIRDIDAFAAILPDGDPQPRAFDAGVLRLMSSAWRTNLPSALAQRHALATAVTDTMNKVRIVSRGNVTLTSHSGTVPVTVANDLDTPVQVKIDIEAGLRLDARETVHTIPAHRQVPVDVHVTANASGVFPLAVSLRTPGGQRYSAPVRLSIRSTAYGATALLITGGATGLLLLTVAVRLVRRARVARRTTRATA